eukprot:2742413-Prymnesium_polylepis.1
MAGLVSSERSIPAVMVPHQPASSGGMAGGGGGCLGWPTGRYGGDGGDGGVDGDGGGCLGWPSGTCGGCD